ncbi:MAG: IS110 family transposase [Candidatus Thermoplasmatota archaeon]
MERKISIGIDISKEKFDACGMDNDGREVLENTTYRQDLEGYGKFLGTAETLSKMLKARLVFGMESTGIYHVPLYDYLRQRGYTVRIFNGLELRGLRKSRIRKTITDKISARLLANYLRMCLDVEKESPVPMELRNLVELVGIRERLVKKQTAIKNQLRRDVDLLFPGFTNVFEDILCKSCVELLKHAVTPREIEEMNLEELYRYVSKRKALQLKNVARKSKSADYVEKTLRFDILSLIRQAECISAEINYAEKMIQEEYQKLDHPIKSIPGVGPITGSTIIAKLGDISKFFDGSKIAAFAGLDVVIKQTGKSKVERHISKRGDSGLRTALYLAAFVGTRCNPVLKPFYEKKIAEGKTQREAVIACARKLCDIIHSVWRRNKPFTYPST